MTDHSISWTERLREWSWPWFPIFAATIILLLALHHFFPYNERAERYECMRLYRAAKTHADTLVVDATVPFKQSGDGGMRCGDRRRLNQLSRVNDVQPPNMRLKLAARGRRFWRNAQWKPSFLSAAPAGRSLSAIR